jgi:hypothetical protein
MMDAGLVATPLFLLLSGVNVGVFFQRAARTAQVCGRMIDRGLFLMIIGHSAIALCGALSSGWQHTWADSFFRSIYITDVIGLALCISGFARHRRIKPRQLLLAATAVYLIGWMATMWLVAASGGNVISTLLLFGTLTPFRTAVDFAVPVLPYLAIVFAGQAIGESISVRLADPEGSRRLVVTLFKASACAIATALLGKFGWALLEPPGGEAVARSLEMTMSPLQKIPPGPAYLLFFGGAGIGIAAVILLMVGKQVAVLATSALAMVGRVSFSVFIAQFWMYWIFVPLLPFSLLARAWPLWFVLSILVLWCGAAVWDRFQGNRWFTVGCASRFAAMLEYRQTHLALSPRRLQGNKAGIKADISA